ncbi:MAG TPA: hypothetical protein VHL53_11595 [Acidimicrobiia bacterium]|nr:hypothetical protein [Acidimicrobiia bacterium]
MTPPVRHLVLDNAAVAALLSTRKRDRRRAAVVEAIAAANGRRLVPTAVRGEAGWDRTAARCADANRLLGADADLVLDGAAANRVVELRRSVPSASVVDAAVAAGAETAGRSGGVVEILTSDVPDLQALAAFLGVGVDVTRLS